ncbi:hypothetical protein V5799_024342 [Amblyomma americanum]|uniref:Uncharacterized protein n=1 Tax=Amblyomma americanum TaxID=6943 RepID=A0AAQ4ECC8_AMBAM
MEDDAETSYWDPRYKQRFIAGLLPPPTGEPGLEAIYATSSIEVYHNEPTFTESSILVGSEGGCRRSRRRRKRRRISWSSVMPRRRESSIFEDVIFVVCAAVMLLILLLLVLQWLWNYLGAQDAPEEERTESGASEEASIIVRPYFTRATAPPNGQPASHRLANGYGSSHARRWRNAFDTDRSDIFRFSGKDQSMSAQRSAAQEALYGCILDSPTRRSHCCYFVVPCYYTLHWNSQLRASIDTDPRCSAQEYRWPRAACPGNRRTKVLLGVRTGQAGTPTLHNDRARGVGRLFRHATLVRNRDKFDGIALWWRDNMYHLRGAADIVRATTLKLLRKNFTLAILIPYPTSGSRTYPNKLWRLKEELQASSYQVFFYPDPSTFVSASWPTPRDITAQVTAEAFRGSSALCYLFANTSFRVNFSKPCDTREVQRTTGPTESVLAVVTDGTCRSLWNASSLVVDRHYYTKKCRGTTGTVFQTAVQAAIFRREVLSLSRTACHGTIDPWPPSSSPVCVDT